MDDVLEENLSNHALEEQREMALNYRNIGIGIMGLADTFIKLGVKYGSELSLTVAKNLMRNIFRRAVISSISLAKTKGSFPGYDPKVWQSDIMTHAFSVEELESFRKIDKLRNCSLVSIAPTGSIGTMLNVSTGVEPFFMLSYKRRTESLNGESTYYDVEVPVVSQYKELTGNKDLPDFFVTAADIHWLDRVRMQATLQEYCDTAISSTVNLPKETTIETIKGVYIQAWRYGCKGITVYVDGSRDAILSAKEEKPKEIVGRKAPKRTKELEADLHLVKIKGEQFIVLVGLLNGKPYETFAFRPNFKINIPNHKGIITKKSKMHYNFKSDILEIKELELAHDSVEEKAATLYSSMLLRHGVDIKYIIKTAKKVNDNIGSFTAAMCRVLSKYIPEEVTGEKCPECGGNVIKEGGCSHCADCEWSRCE